MSAIVTLDEITEQLGPPVCLRWVKAPGEATAAIARFRHSGTAVDLSASGSFRLIFHLTDSDVETGLSRERKFSRVGDIVTSFTFSRERIRVLGAADTIHLLFSPKLAESLRADQSYLSSSRIEPALRISAVQAFVAMAQNRTDAQMERAVLSIPRTLRENISRSRPAGGLAPHARRAIHQLLANHISTGVSVPELAEAAELSLHHFIKVCRETEGYTPHTLLLHKRIERAVALLLKPRARVDEVAITIGFSSPSHFVSSFRRLVGVTPAAFRNAVAR